MNSPRPPVPSSIPTPPPAAGLREPQEVDTDTHVLHTPDRDALGEAEETDENPADPEVTDR